MRTFIALALMSIFGWPFPPPRPTATARSCAPKYIAGSAPCTCVGPVLEEEYDEEELDPLLLVMKTFMEGLAAKTPGG